MPNDQDKRNTNRVDSDAVHIQEGTSHQRLVTTISEALRHAAEGLVHSKYLLDKIVRNNNAPGLQNELSRGNYSGPLSGPDFFRSVFPFVPVWGGSQRFQALVPTSLTLGCSWRWRSEHLTEKDRQNCLELFTNPSSNSLRTQTGYLWVRSLGLLLPGEGKNRVDFLREENVEWFPASITETDYPEAARQVLYSVKVHGQDQCWAVLDGRWVERVAHPEWATPVLRAYGVMVEQKWPQTFPSVQIIAADFDRPDKQPKFFDRSVVDLDRIATERASQDALVACSYLELRGVVRLASSSTIWWWLCVFATSLLAVAYLLRSGDWAMALAVVAGAGVGASLLPVVLVGSPIFLTKMATKNQYWQHD